MKLGSLSRRLGIAAVATPGYGGLLGGPPLIGTIAELIGLRLALVTILLGVLVITASASLIRNTLDRR